MKKINIVKENREFNDVIQTGKFIKNKYFVIYYKNNNLKICNNKNKHSKQHKAVLDYD